MGRRKKVDIQAEAEAEKRLDAKKWLEKVARAQKVKDSWMERFRIELGYEFFEGAQRPPNEDEWITINLIYSTLLSMLPMLYRTDPYYYIRVAKTYTPDPQAIEAFEIKARIRQAYLNYLFKEQDVKPKARLSIQDAFFQYGVAKIIYKADMIENPNRGQEIVDENGNVMVGKGGKPLLEPDEYPTNERYQILRIHPGDFLVDEDAGPLDEDVHWKAQVLRLPIEQVREDKRYTAAFRSKVKPSAYRDESEVARERKKKGNKVFTGESDNAQPDIAVLYEIYCKRTKKWLVVAQDCDEFAVEPSDLPSGMECDPFVDLRFTLRDDSWYPLPPVSQWLDPQKAYCERRSKIATHNKRFNRKYVLRGIAFDDAETAAQKLESGDDGSVLISNGTFQGQEVTPIQDAPLDMQVHTEVSYSRNDFNELAIGVNQRGGAAGIDSATEAGIIETRAQMREGDWIGLVTDFLVNIGRKLDQTVQAHITRDEAVKVTGPQGEYWQVVRADDYGEIAGEYQYSVNVGQRQAQIPEIERAQLLSFLQVIGAQPLLLRAPRLIRMLAEKFHIDDDVLLAELKQLGILATTGQIQTPGGGGSAPNVTENNPATASGGGYGIANFRGGQ